MNYYITNKLTISSSNSRINKERRTVTCIKHKIIVRVRSHYNIIMIQTGIIKVDLIN